MYKVILVNKDTWWVGVNDRSTDRFEALWSLPNGVAYNTYVIAAEAKATRTAVERSHRE